MPACQRNNNPDKPSTPVSHVQDTVYPCAASSSAWQSIHLSIIPTHIRSKAKTEETPKAISQANSGPTRKPCAAVAGRAEHTHVRSVGMPPKCPSAHCCAATQGHKCPLPLASCHTARPGANTLPFPSCCLTARLETQTQSNFVPTWTHPNKENASLPRRGAVIHQGLVTTPISLQFAPTNHIPSAVIMPLPIMKSDSNKLQTQSAHTQLRLDWATT